eukprot:6190586-Pleurochrysis_carterae.AAC.4
MLGLASRLAERESGVEEALQQRGVNWTRRGSCLRSRARIAMQGDYSTLRQRRTTSSQALKDLKRSVRAVSTPSSRPQHGAHREQVARRAILHESAPVPQSLPCDPSRTVSLSHAVCSGARHPQPQARHVHRRCRATADASRSAAAGAAAALMRSPRAQPPLSRIGAAPRSRMLLSADHLHAPGERLASASPTRGGRTCCEGAVPLDRPATACAACPSACAVPRAVPVVATF